MLETSYYFPYEILKNSSVCIFVVLLLCLTNDRLIRHALAICDRSVDLHQCHCVFWQFFAQTRNFLALTVGGLMPMLNCRGQLGTPRTASWLCFPPPSLDNSWRAIWLLYSVILSSKMCKGIVKIQNRWERCKDFLDARYLLRNAWIN